MDRFLATGSDGDKDQDASLEQMNLNSNKNHPNVMERIRAKESGGPDFTFCLLLCEFGQVT